MRVRRGRNVYTLISVLQVLAGCAVAGLAVYATLLISSLPIRETSYWTGFPLLITGILGIYFSAVEVDVYTGNFRAYCVRCFCFVLNVLCLMVCGVASVFPAYHASVLATLQDCHISDTGVCKCVQLEPGRLPRSLTYQTQDCGVLYPHLYIILILLASLNIVACLLSLAFLVYLWRSRYANFYTGLRFFSYSAQPSHHPWQATSPPYVKTTSVDSRSGNKHTTGVHGTKKKPLPPTSPQEKPATTSGTSTKQ